MILNFTAGAKGAEIKYFLFAVERTANKKIQALGANHKSDLRIARFRINVRFMFALNLNKYPEYFLP